MAKKQKKRLLGTGQLANMTYKDLKAACIMRGLEFEEVSKSDFSSLSHFYHCNYHIKANRELLEKYQDWMADTLVRLGYADNDPVVKFREFATEESDEDGNKSGGTLKRTILKKGGGETKKVRKKKERDTTFGILKGTKKDYIYTLTAKAHSKGWAKEKCLKKILEKAAEKELGASDKSIKIWFKKAYKELTK